MQKQFNNSKRKKNNNNNEHIHTTLFYSMWIRQEKARDFAQKPNVNARIAKFWITNENRTNDQTDPV